MGQGTYLVPRIESGQSNGRQVLSPHPTQLLEKEQRKLTRQAEIPAVVHSPSPTACTGEKGSGNFKETGDAISKPGLRSRKQLMGALKFLAKEQLQGGNTGQLRSRASLRKGCHPACCFCLFSQSPLSEHKPLRCPFTDAPARPRYPDFDFEDLGQVEVLRAAEVQQIHPHCLQRSNSGHY